MIQLLKNNNFILMGAILLAVLSTQVFPYIHFHHSHENNKSNISSHFNHPKYNHHSEEHDGEHNHDGNAHIVADWNYIKTVSNATLKSFVKFEWSSNLIFNEKQTLASIVYQEITHPLPNKILLLSDLSRGPPAPLS